MLPHTLLVCLVLVAFTTAPGQGQGQVQDVEVVAPPSGVLIRPPVGDALRKAACAGDVDQVRQLLVAGARNADTTRPLDYFLYDVTALHCAAALGHVDVVRALVASGMPSDLGNHGAWNGFTALQAAAHFDGTPETMKVLLEAGAQVDETDVDGYTPLHTAVSVGRDPGIIQVLLDAGADVNIRNNEGESILFNAAYMSSAEVIHMLLRAGAKVNERSEEDGWTPLHAAAYMGKADVVEVLLEAGAEVMVRSKDGETPLDLAQGWGNRRVEDILADRQDMEGIGRARDTMEDENQGVSARKETSDEDKKVVEKDRQQGRQEVSGERFMEGDQAFDLTELEVLLRDPAARSLDSPSYIPPLDLQYILAQLQVQGISSYEGSENEGQGHEESGYEGQDYEGLENKGEVYDRVEYQNRDHEGPENDDQGQERSDSETEDQGNEFLEDESESHEQPLVEEVAPEAGFVWNFEQAGDGQRQMERETSQEEVEEFSRRQAGDGVFEAGQSPEEAPLGGSEPIARNDNVDDIGDNSDDLDDNSDDNSDDLDDNSDDNSDDLDDNSDDNSDDLDDDMDDFDDQMENKKDALDDPVYTRDGDAQSQETEVRVIDSKEYAVDEQHQGYHPRKRL